jgi:hypothetical protein
MKVSILFRLSLDFVSLYGVSDDRPCKSGECERMLYEQERRVIYPSIADRV